MFNRIKNRVDAHLVRHIEKLDRKFSLRKISPLLFKHIKGFLLRKGKRIRPVLSIVGYRGFAKKEDPEIYTCVLSLELLHNFMLIHDDIIDDSDLRRGLPSMHKMLEKYLSRYKNKRFGGKEPAIVLGDSICGMAIDSLLSANIPSGRKEKALKKLTEAALYTCSGEFVELLSVVKDMDIVTKEEIDKIYNLKTAYYSFAAPLAIGAILAGARQAEIDKLSRYGMYLGRAFQIKDDILDIFGEERTIGKPPLTDIREGKKTLLLWYAYKNSSERDKSYIKKVLSKNRLSVNDLHRIRKIMLSSGALKAAKDEVVSLSTKAKRLASSLKMKPKYKNALDSYLTKVLDLKFADTVLAWADKN